MVTSSTARARRAHGSSPAVARRLLAVFLAAHGVAHLAGTSDVLARASHRDPVGYLAGGWTISDPTALRAFGVVWALLAVAFVGAAAVVVRPGWAR